MDRVGSKQTEWVGGRIGWDWIGSPIIPTRYTRGMDARASEPWVIVGVDNFWFVINYIFCAVSETLTAATRRLLWSYHSNVQASRIRRHTKPKTAGHSTGLHIRME